MTRSFLVSAGLLALFHLCFPVLTPLPGEEAAAKDKPGNQESKLPRGLEGAFEIPREAKDAHGNPVG
jgi:hypothetical protein